MSLKERGRWLYHKVISVRFVLWVLALTVLASVPGTVLRQDLYRSTPQRLLLALMGLSLLLCSLKRLRRLPLDVLTLHAGTLVVLAGGLVSTFGFVATVNIYEGTEVDRVYRWDIGREVSLGFSLGLEEVGVRYYPAKVKVGVLKGTRKEGLFELFTGQSFRLGGYTVVVEALRLPQEALTLRVLEDFTEVGVFDTASEPQGPDFPYRFVLVAYQRPAVRDLWVKLVLRQGSRVLASGISRVNSPFRWGGMKFHHVQTSADPYGFLYAGLQIVKDPGRPLVFAGFGVQALGAVLYLARRLKKET